MINQSIHFEVSGDDAHRLLAACREQGIQPDEAFSQFMAHFAKPTTDKTTKKSRAGALAHYANPDLIDQEDSAWERAVVEKHAPR